MSPRTTLARYGALVAALVTATALAVPASAQESVTRLAADDNVGAALAWSELTYSDDTASVALLGRDDVFADSLASGGPQGALDAPLLLTATDSLDSRVEAELDRLGVETVYVLGGEAAISADVVDALESAGYDTVRLGGTTRLDTAVAIAEEFFPTPTTIVIARAFGTSSDETQAFADSLWAAGYAAATNQPAVLTETDVLSDATMTYLESADLEEAVVIGGEAAVGAGVLTQLSDLGINDVRRLSGANRFATAVAMNVELGLEDVTSADRVLLLEGQDSDAWAGGFAAAAQARVGNAAAVLSNGASLPPETLDYLQDGGLPLVCGPYVSESACDAAAAALAGEDPPAAQPETGPAAAAFRAVVTGAEEVPTTGDPDGEGTAEITITGEAGELCYDISLTGVDPITAAHIHEAPAGQAGPVVITLAGASDYDAATGTQAQGCLSGVDQAQLDDIIADPGDYYVNLHNAVYPDGALRGQLS